MTEAEAEAEEFRLQPEVHASDFFPDELYFDEPQPVNKVFKPAITEREIQARALRFAGNILFLSRTHQGWPVAITGGEASYNWESDCRANHAADGVTKRQVQRALRFVRAYCGVPRNVARLTE